MKEIVQQITKEFGYEWESVMSFLNVETGGRGFDTKTAKLIIQFEPVWFRKKEPYAPSGKWSVNKVDVQVQEWIAFNDAFKMRPLSAMSSTSIGIGQVMGGHWRRLGYSSVGAMWDDAKKGLERQIWQVCQFIKTDPQLEKALKRHDWNAVAYLYNGPKYKELAIKWGRTPYNISMKLEYTQLKQAA